MIFLPATRPWACDRVCAAIIASDVPREAVVYVDAPGAECFADTLRVGGFTVHETRSGRGEPPDHPVKRRERHLLMRRDSQTLTCDLGRVLYLEDDCLVPSDIWGRLASLLDIGHRAASGVQVSRHGNLRTYGVWEVRGRYASTVYHDGGVHMADAVGHYALMCEGSDYAAASMDPGELAVDFAHTRNLAPIAVDFDCRVGHLRDNGRVIDEPIHRIRVDVEDRMREVGRVERIATPSGPFFPHLHGDDYDPDAPLDEFGIHRPVVKEVPVGRITTNEYVTKDRVVIDGKVVCGRRRRIPMSQALEWARMGVIDDPDLLVNRMPSPHDPRTGVKPDAPREAKKPAKR